jgi:hypothetical protein
MVPLIAFLSVLEPVRLRTKFSNRKTYVFFSFKCLICDLKKIILQQCLDPYPNPNFFLDSDPAKTYRTDSFGL